MDKIKQVSLSDELETNVESGSPAGMITPFIGGYFTDGQNGGFVAPIGNAVSIINAYLNPYGWHVCDGTALNDSSSPIFNGAGRYLPNLTDSRFLMGSSTGGVVGGNNSLDHTHSVPSHSHSLPSHSHTGPSHSHTLSHYHSMTHDHGSFTCSGTSPSTTTMASHQHLFRRYLGTTHVSGNYPTTNSHSTYNRSHNVSIVPEGSSSAHSHSINVPNYSANTGYNSHDSGSAGTGATGTWSGTSGDWSGTSGSCSNAENRPQFLSCFYIMKVN